MARPADDRRPTCGERNSIDVRRWHREGLLRAGRYSSYSWTLGGKESNRINVRAEWDAVILMSRSADGVLTEQRVPITWTACHLGGSRPWFVCSGGSNERSCGRRVALLYDCGRLFVCRHCCGLAYASQQRTPFYRSIDRDRKVRMRLGGGPNLLDPFPKKPPRMHQSTYLRFAARGIASQSAWCSLGKQMLDRSSTGKRT